LFFANGLRRPLASAFATHPPLHERIRRLDPSWNGEFGILEGPPKASSPASAGRAAGAAALSAAAGSPTASPTGARSAEAVVTDVGSPSPETLAYAGALLGKMPEALVTAAHTTRGAMALVLALAMADSDENDLAAEWGVVGKSGFSDLTEPIEEILPLVRAQGREARLPLLDLALPTLQGLSPDEASRFLKTVEDTVIADRRLRLFEYTMVHALGRRLGVPQRDEDSGARFGSFAGVR